MCEEDESKIRKVSLDYAGIYYAETSINKAYVNIVEKEDKIELVLVINQDDLGNQFHAMTYGKVLGSISFLEMMQQAKFIEDQELVHKGITDGHTED